jgi:hypothetical protein
LIGSRQITVGDCQFTLFLCQLAVFLGDLGLFPGITCRLRAEETSKLHFGQSHISQMKGPIKQECA